MAQDAKSDVLLNAMTSELTRSYEKLKNAEKAPLYYIGYEAYDERNYYVSAVEGAVDTESDIADRKFDVDIRVGDKTLDNTHELKGGKEDENSKTQAYGTAPVEADADAIRSKLWVLTDMRYKSALDQYAKVKMNKSVTAEEEDRSGDFSAAPGEAFYEKAAFPAFDREKFKAMAARLSGKFKQYDFIYNSYVSFSVETVNRYMVNSEGSSIVTGNTFVRFVYGLNTRTNDGMGLSRTKIYDSDSPGEVPDEAAIAGDLAASIAELKALRAAPPEQPYSGPVLLGARAAGVFFHEILGHRLEGHRQKSEASGQTFSSKVGQRIMPEFLTVYDDPTLSRRDGRFLRGSYRYDDEAVAARKAPLVENGVLKGFLMGRSPIKNSPVSNGHGRRQEGHEAVARQGNLIVASSKAFPYAELRRRLIEEVKKAKKPYGLVVDDIEGGFTITERSLPQSFSVQVTLGHKVYPDGRPDEPVRGLNLIGTPLQTFSRIILTGDDYGVFNGDCGAESGWVPVSSVAPSLLFSEMETEKVQKSNTKPPVLKPPYTDR
jgi:predicted Zn-dependent protease